MAAPLEGSVGSGVWHWAWARLIIWEELFLALGSSFEVTHLDAYTVLFFFLTNHDYFQSSRSSKAETFPF